MPLYPVLWDSTQSIKESQPSYGIDRFPARSQAILGEACAACNAPLYSGLWDSTQGIRESQPSCGIDCFPARGQAILGEACAACGM